MITTTTNTATPASTSQDVDRKVHEPEEQHRSRESHKIQGTERNADTGQQLDNVSNLSPNFCPSMTTIVTMTTTQDSSNQAKPFTSGASSASKSTMVDPGAGQVESVAAVPTATSKLARDTVQGHQLPQLLEKSVIVHKDENGFGLRIKGQAPVYIEHVHEGGAAWRAGVRSLDAICKVNGISVNQMDHKDVVLMFKGCTRFVTLTLVGPTTGLLRAVADAEQLHNRTHQMPLDLIADNANEAYQAALFASCHRLASPHQRQASTLSHRLHQNLNYSLDQQRDDLPLFGSSAHYATLDSAVSASSLLMDRTGSCRQRTASAATKLTRRDSNDRQSISPMIIASTDDTDIEKSPSGQSHSHQSANRKRAVQQPTGMGALHQQDSVKLFASTNSLPLGGAVVASAKSGGHDVVGSKLHSRLGAQQQLLPVQPERPLVINKRVEIIRELIDTERTHTERLKCLDELFYRPLKQANYVSSEQLRAVFSCHRTLYKIHKQIYRTLLSANYDVYSEPLVGSALIEIFEGDLKRRLERAACAFCTAQANNVELLNKITRRDSKVGEFIAHVTSQRMTGRLGIKDLLASCFQRLTKYPLLLENLLKATPVLPVHEEPHGREAEDEAAAERRRELKLRLSGMTSACGGGGGGGQGQIRRLKIDQHSVSDDDGDDNQDNDQENYHEYDQDNELDDVGAVGRDEREFDESISDEDEAEHQLRLRAAEEIARRNSHRMLAISLAEEREFIERALGQSRQMLVRVNESIRVAMSRLRLKEIWRRTDKYPGVPLIDIAKQQVIHEGPLTLRLSRRSFDVYVLLLNNYIIILTREGQDKYRLKFFTPEGKSSTSSAIASSAITLAGGGGLGGTASAANAANNLQPLATQTSGASAAPISNHPHQHHLHLYSQAVYSPVFVIDEHLTTRDAATDENGFYLLCKRKDDSRIYELASRSPAERSKWRDKIQWTIEHQMSRSHRRPSCGSTLTKSSSDTSANGLSVAGGAGDTGANSGTVSRLNAGSARQTGDANDLNVDTKLRAVGARGALSTSGCNQEASVRDPSTTPTPQNRTQKTPTSSSSSPASSTSSYSSAEPTKIVGTISYVIDDGIVMPSKMGSSRVFVDQAIQVNISNGTNSVKSATVESPSA